MVVHRQTTPLGASGGTAAYNYDDPPSPASTTSGLSDGDQSNTAQASSMANGSAKDANDAAAPSMAEFLGLKEFACGAPPALARGAAGAEQMASSVLSFLKSAASNTVRAGQQVIEKNKSAEDSLLHGGASSMSKESDAADTRDQPDIEGT